MMPPKGKPTKTLQRTGEEGVSPGGWVLTLSYIRRIGPYLGVQFFFEFQLKKWEGVYNETVDIFGDHCKTGPFLGVIYK